MAAVLPQTQTQSGVISYIRGSSPKTIKLPFNMMDAKDLITTLNTNLEDLLPNYNVIADFGKYQGENGNFERIGDVNLSSNNYAGFKVFIDGNDMIFVFLIYKKFNVLVPLSNQDQSLPDLLYKTSLDFNQRTTEGNYYKEVLSLFMDGDKANVVYRNSSRLIPLRSGDMRKTLLDIIVKKINSSSVRKLLRNNGYEIESNLKKRTLVDEEGFRQYLQNQANFEILGKQLTLTLGCLYHDKGVVYNDNKNLGIRISGEQDVSVVFVRVKDILRRTLSSTQVNHQNDQSFQSTDWLFDEIYKSVAVKYGELFLERLLMKLGMSTNGDVRSTYYDIYLSFRYVIPKLLPFIGGFHENPNRKFYSADKVGVNSEEDVDRFFVLFLLLYMYQNDSKLELSYLLSLKDVLRENILKI